MAWFDNPAVMTLVGVAVGGIVGVVDTLAKTALDNRSAEKLKWVDLAYQAALDDYKSMLENARGQRGAKLVPPLMTYIAHHVAVSSALSGRSIHADDMVAKLLKAREQLEPLMKHLYEEHESLSSEPPGQ